MSSRFDAAILEFERLNAEDPKKTQHGGRLEPRELVQARNLARWIERLSPNAPEALRLAAHCQHLRRWEIPRSAYPEGRTGYLAWRKRLGRFHAARAAEVLRRVGYDQATIDQVSRINQKRGTKTDADVQTMEDALCLSFLEHELSDFAEKHESEKVVDILGKTWRKMSARGRAEALSLRLAPVLRELIERAIDQR